MDTKSQLAALLAAASICACGPQTTVASRSTTAPAPRTETVRYIRGLDETLGLQRDSAIAAALADIDPKRIRRIDSALVSFGTRNTFSDTMSSSRGIGAARRWIHSEFEQYARDCNGCLKVEYYGQVQKLRRAGSEASRLITSVVPVRGRPNTNNGFSMGASRSSGCCLAQASIFIRIAMKLMRSP